jgi:hypothetical protein
VARFIQSLSRTRLDSRLHRALRAAFATEEIRMRALLLSNLIVGLCAMSACQPKGEAALVTDNQWIGHGAWPATSKRISDP